jgi:hypothetical protein
MRFRQVTIARESRALNAPVGHRSASGARNENAYAVRTGRLRLANPEQPAFVGARLLPQCFRSLFFPFSFVSLRFEAPALVPTPGLHLVVL